MQLTGKERCHGPRVPSGAVGFLRLVCGVSGSDSALMPNVGVRPQALLVIRTAFNNSPLFQLVAQAQAGQLEVSRSAATDMEGLVCWGELGRAFWDRALL